MSALRDVLLVLTVVTSGLSAGLLATFAYAVMPGMRRASPLSSVAVMQRINVAIINPLFAVIFFGPLLFGGLGIVFWWDEPLRWWLVAGVGLTVAAVAITMVVNVPLNNRLAAAGTVADGDAPVVWTQFARPWVRWNIIRAVVATAGFVVIVVGLVQISGQ
ncbi:DUF1772 domain-containing protein [Gordonia sp. HNM0687]|uniref:DUF1772 domain-containing protein n=1 Tax=Gordonia mangrovi TaxID=2665643 RepID=A0A6L7GXW7_9ACTN|nr:anthrone oxygenase family protein [Gordonia mangrovi]MXP24001.1 DUF1772 domain-containing protein [Gordonia mangrovi]UVF76545.1 DUF1772 domain-containing protein [Gordonia mangrovi]